MVPGACNFPSFTLLLRFLLESIVAVVVVVVVVVVGGGSGNGAFDSGVSTPCKNKWR